MCGAPWRGLGNQPITRYVATSGLGVLGEWQ
jgi:hypothetical protein